MKGKRDYELAKKLLAEAGYKNEPIVLLVATDVAITKAQGDVTADLLKRIGMNVQYQALDWGTVGQRRAKQGTAVKGGWNIFHTWHAGADCVNPAPYTALDCQRADRVVRLAEIRPGAGEDRRLVWRCRTWPRKSR